MTDELYYNIIYGIEDFVENMKVKYAFALKRWSIFYAEMRVCFDKYASACARALERYILNLERMLQDGTDKVIMKFDKLVRAYAPFIIDGYYYIRNAADSIRHCYNGK